MVGVLLIVTGACVGGYQYMVNRTNVARMAVEIDRANHGLLSSMPATTKPSSDSFKNYKVAPDAPRYIYIDKISVKALIKPMQLTQDNTIEAPANVHDAGWLVQSSKPGRPGAVIMDGHVANWATMSVFHDLKKLRPGDLVTIERGDGVKIDYKVVTTQSYPADKVDMQSVMKPVANKPGLNLITCDGKVIKGNEFDRRLVVFAEQFD
jgi:LPXTG-site transpeptidase (sortase) family protein